MPVHIVPPARNITRTHDRVTTPPRSPTSRAEVFKRGKKKVKPMRLIPSHPIYSVTSYTAPAYQQHQLHNDIFLIAQTMFPRAIITPTTRLLLRRPHPHLLPRRTSASPSPILPSSLTRPLSATSLRKHGHTTPPKPGEELLLPPPPLLSTPFTPPNGPLIVGKKQTLRNIHRQILQPPQVCRLCRRKPTGHRAGTRPRHGRRLRWVCRLLDLSCHCC